MNNFIYNQKGKIPFKMVILGLALILILTTSGIILIQKNQNIDEANDKPFNVKIPIKYTQPLVIAAFNNVLQIKPVNAKSSKMIKTGENAVKYIDAYKNTDVEQIKYPNKLKESLILKSPDHPGRFEYKININDFIWEINENGDILFKQKQKEQRFEIDEIRDNVIKATMNTDYTDGHPLVFRILKPFLIEHANNDANKFEYHANEDTGGVEVKIEGNKLILIPDKEWLQNHNYPIILDPTIETIPREQEQVIIGDENSDEFKPQVKLYKWGDETYVSLESMEEGDDYFTQNGGKIIWHNTDKSKEYNFYPEENNFEYEIILKQKPKSNVIELKIDSKGLRFSYQPPLNEEDYSAFGVDYCTETQCFINGKEEIIVNRPENVVGSYSVYHIEKNGDYTKMGGKNYRAGKAFHIYRPKMIDADGNWVWGELNIDEQAGRVTVAIPQEFLDSAVYPVKHAAGFTFGYTTLPGSSTWAEDRMFAWIASPSDGDGTGVAIHSYLKSTNSANVVSGALYDDADDELIDSGNATTDEATITSTSLIDVTMSFTVAPTILDADTYQVTVWIPNITGTADIGYDSTGPGMADFSAPGYDTWPSPHGMSSSNYDWSAWCEYSAGNATPSVDSVTDTPDPTNPNRSVTFTVDWSDADAGDLVKVKICKSSTLTSQNCADSFWASSTAFTTTDPEKFTYDVVAGDHGQTRHYFVHVCDDEAACTATSTASTFSVNSKSTVPNIDIRGGVDIR